MAPHRNPGQFCRRWFSYERAVSHKRGNVCHWYINGQHFITLGFFGFDLFWFRKDCASPMATHSSTLAWKIPWMEEPGGLQSMGSLRVGQDWATSLSLFTFMHWRRKWQPTPVFLPGESQGWGSLVGCRLWGRTESDTTEATQQQQWLSGKESTCQWTRCGFSPWVGKIPWKRKWQPTPVFLPEKSQATIHGVPKESDTT